MTLQRIIALLAGVAPFAAEYLNGSSVPPWLQIAGALTFGLAVNAERVMQKRKKGAPTFNSDALPVVIAFVSLALSLVAACKSTGDMVLPESAFKHLTDADAVTVSEYTTIYKRSDKPPSDCLVAHEFMHKTQARKIGNLLAEYGVIDDDEPSRMATWIFVYTLDYVQYGYDNRFEKEAREKTKAICQKETIQ